MSIETSGAIVRFPGVCPIPFAPTFVRLPGDAGRIARLESEVRVLALVARAAEGECVALREEVARLAGERDDLRDALAAATAPPAPARRRARTRRCPDWLTTGLAALVLCIDAAWYPDTETIA